MNACRMTASSENNASNHGNQTGSPRPEDECVICGEVQTSPSSAPPRCGHLICGQCRQDYILVAPCKLEEPGEQESSGREGSTSWECPLCPHCQPTVPTTADQTPLREGTNRLPPNMQGKSDIKGDLWACSNLYLLLWHSVKMAAYAYSQIDGLQV